MKNLLTDEQNREFDAAMAYWQKALNLSDWRVERGKGLAKGAMASIVTNYGARLATYRTGDWKGDVVNSESIRATALHESLHILLAELLTLRTSTTTEPEVMESAEHRVVNTLEKLLQQKVAP